MYPVWVLCNTIYLIFISINIIHERVISLYLTLYDFKPKIVRHRAAQSYKKRKQSASKFKRKSRRIFTKQYWNNHLIQPTKTATYHIIFNIFHLDRHNMKLGALYVWSEIKRNNFSFFIGLFTVFISCFVGAFLPAINDKSPVVFVKLAENSVGENDMLLTASFSGTPSSTSSASNGTHNETLSYTYTNDWIYDYNIANISNILSANNITETQLENMLQDINTSVISNTSNITRAIMNITGLSYKNLNNIINFYNDNNDNLTLENFEELLTNYTQEIDENLAQLNLTEGQEKDWQVEVQNQLFGSNPLLNYTYIENKLYNVPEVSGSAPRWWLLGNVTAGKSPYAVSTIVMAIDSILELDAGIGRAWKHKNIPPLEGNGAYVMNTITRAMNISGTGVSHNYNDAIGHDFTMFANIGGFQDSFDMNLAGMYLNTNNSVIMENNLIQNGIAYSCISVYIKPNSRPDDFNWIIYNGNDTLMEGNVYINTNTCINATDTEYMFAIYDRFGNGLNDDLNSENNGYYIVYWDDEIALEHEGKFGYGSYDEEVLTRPLSAYGKSRIWLDDEQQANLTAFLEFILDDRTQRAIFNSMIQGNTDEETIDIIMDEVLPEYNATDMVNSLQNSTYNESVELVGGWIVYYIGFGGELKVSQSVETGEGKWSSLLGSVTVIDAQELSNILFNSSVQFAMAVNELVNIGVGLGYVTSLEMIKNIELMEYYFEEIGDSDIYNYAIQTIIMYTDRLDAYMGTLLNLNIHMVEFSNAVFNGLGYEFSATITLPIYSQMQFLIFFKLFLNEMLFSCIVLMTTLVLIVIYSLLLNDVEERTYTYGMLRALGMKRVTLIQIMLLKAITFSIPATIIALLLCQLANIPLIGLIESFAYINLTVKLPSICFINGLLIGFIIPMIAIYIPTSRALSKTLRDSLDIYHHVSSNIQITIIRLEKLGFSIPIMGIAIILVTYGVICSILVPISIYYQTKNVCFNIFNFFNLCFGSGYDLFFGIFGAILLSMIYGMCIIAALISQPLSTLFIHMILSFKILPHYILKSIILKNLYSHSYRNIKTSVMFITTLAFCIFAGVSNSFLTNSAVDFFAWFTGSDFEIYAFRQINALPYNELNIYLNKQKKLNKINDFTSITFPISWFANDQLNIDEVTVSSLAGQPQLSQWIVGCEKNYLNVMYEKFLDIKEVAAYHNKSIGGSGYPTLKDNKNLIDVVNILYTDAGHATLDFEKNGINIPPVILNGKYYYALNEDNDRNYNYYNERNEKIDKLINNINNSYYEYIDIIVSTSLVSALGIDINDPLILSIGVYDSNYDYYEFKYMMKIRAILNKIPGLVMLPYDLQYASFLAEFQNAVISVDAYKKIFTDICDYLNIDKIPENIWQKIAIKMNSNASSIDYDDINEGIRNFVPDQAIEVDNMYQINHDVRDNISLVNDFFLILGIIGLILSFFILWLSFLANIRNSSWELGVLRSLGVNTFQIVCIYMYEALAIIFSCIILGTIIGTLTSLILNSQSNLFLMMPLYLDFPWTLYITICTVAISVAIIGSYLPMRKYIYDNVAAVLRGK